MKHFKVTEEIAKDILKYWGKSYLECDDNDAQEIIETFVNPIEKVINASWGEEDVIDYDLEEEEEENEDENIPQRAFTEEYLNYIGMSLHDFA